MIVDQVVSFTIATDDVTVTVPPPLRPAVHVQLEAPGRQVPMIVDQVVSFTIATDDVTVTVPPPLAW